MPTATPLAPRTAPPAADLQWLVRLAGEHRRTIRQSPFFRAVAAAARPRDLGPWVRQLYHVSTDYAAALRMRQALCSDDRFDDAFADHARGEADHPRLLADWMREHGLVGPDEDPAATPPLPETLAVTSYFYRLIVCEPAAHQAVALTLATEGIAADLAAAARPALAALGLDTSPYWHAHADTALGPPAPGLDRIPGCHSASPAGRGYARVVREAAGLFARMFDAWARTLTA